MDTLTFLKTVWPESGLYTLAVPWQPPGALKPIYRHSVFSTVEAAAAEAQRLSGTADVYFAVHTLRERRVWDPLKKNPKDGSLGAYSVRKHDNMAAACSFFLDIDVKANNPQAYATIAEAVQALGDFCRATAMPWPMVIGSGGGLHVYWVTSKAIPSAIWRMFAEKLRLLASHYGLRYDPARTTDVSSVLRVVGTLHLKDRSNPRPVVVHRAGKVIPVADFLNALKAACIRAGIKTAMQTRRPLHDDDPLPDLGSNVTSIQPDRPPPRMEAVLTACAQVRFIHENQGEVSEPEWFHALNLVRFVEGADEWAHRISNRHPGYTADETTDKFERLKAGGAGPTSCGVLAAVGGEDRCQGCRFSGRVKNPIMAARLMDEAPAPPSVPLPTGDAPDDDEPLALLPNPPKPYRRTRDSGVVVDMKSSDGDDITVTIYEHDLHPLRRVANVNDKTESHHWRVTLPREGHKDFTIEADALYDTRKLMSALANNGVYPATGNVPMLRDYMIAYIAALQKAIDADVQSTHLGWSDDKTQFILPNGAIQRDGTMKPVILSKQAERVAQTVQKGGTLEGQIEALKFYDNPAYVANQFYIMAGLAAPIYHMTGHHGVGLNAMGAAGQSKSTSNYTAASFWGHPKHYPINGTNSGATTRGRNERITTLANLPVCVDEVTHMSPRDAMDMAMNVTQPGHRIRLDVTGTERASPTGHKSTILLTTSNTSLHELLATENAGGTAGSMRIVEIRFTVSGIHAKWEADEFLLKLEQNYGHVGEKFIRYVMQHYDKVHRQVRDMMRYIDEKAQITPAERFWSALIASVLVATAVSRKLGITSWDPTLMLAWMLNEQIPAMRMKVVEEYTDPINTLMNYLTEIHGATIIVDSDKPDVLQSKREATGRPKIDVVVPFRGNALLAQYDVATRMIWMAHKPFRTYCQKNGISWQDVVEALRRDEVIVGRARRVLGGNTDYAKAAVDAHIIDASHEAIWVNLLPAWAEKVTQSTGNVVPLRREGAG